MVLTMKTRISLCALLGCAALFFAACNNTEKPASAPDEKVQVLAKHRTIATYEGTQYRLCMGRTTLCPDRCGDSGEFARFKIDQYTAFEKNSQYGEKRDEFLIQVSDYNKKPIGDPAVSKTVQSLKTGDKVTLWWDHLYVTKDGVSAPRYPLVKLEKLK